MLKLKEILDQALDFVKIYQSEMTPQMVEYLLNDDEFASLLDFYENSDADYEDVSPSWIEDVYDFCVKNIPIWQSILDTEEESFYANTN